MLKTLKFKFIELRDERFNVGLINQLELHETFMRLTVRCYSQMKEFTEDALQTWGKSELRHRELTVHRNRIVAVGKTYVPDIKVWLVYMVIDGLSGDMDIYFKRESAAQALVDRLTLYSNLYNASDQTRTPALIGIPEKGTGK